LSQEWFVDGLEAHHHPMGGGSSVKVHRLAKVGREDVILPQKTLATSNATWLALWPPARR